MLEAEEKLDLVPMNTTICNLLSGADLKIPVE